MRYRTSVNHVTEITELCCGTALHINTEPGTASTSAQSSPNPSTSIYSQAQPQPQHRAHPVPPHQYTASNPSTEFTQSILISTKLGTTPAQSSPNLSTSIHNLNPCTELTRSLYINTQPGTTSTNFQTETLYIVSSKNIFNQCFISLHYTTTGHSTLIFTM